MFWFLCFSEWDLNTLSYDHSGVFIAVPEKFSAGKKRDT